VEGSQTIEKAAPEHILGGNSASAIVKRATGAFSHEHACPYLTRFCERCLMSTRVSQTCAWPESRYGTRNRSIPSISTRHHQWNTVLNAGNHARGGAHNQAREPTQPGGCAMMLASNKKTGGGSTASRGNTRRRTKVLRCKGQKKRAALKAGLQRAFHWPRAL
jgi:hypothetical protein